jgi:hypothetical protein
MAVFIIHLGKGHKLTPKEIDRLIRVHQTPQDTVMLRSSGEFIPGGFAVTREDDLAGNVLKRDKKARESVDPRVMRAVAMERKVISEGAASSGDTSVTGGAKPITRLEEDDGGY